MKIYQMEMIFRKIFAEMKYIKCLNNSLKYVSMAMAYMLLGYSCSDDISELGDQPIKPKTEYKSLDW